MKLAISLFFTIIVLGVALLFISLKEQQTPGCGVKAPQFVCGTRAFYNKEFSEGRKLFNTNCAACHKLSKNMTGPALASSIKKYDSIAFKNFMLKGIRIQTNEENPFNTWCIQFPNLKEDGINNLYNYISSSNN